MSEEPNLVAEMQTDTENLYREESFTDMKIAQIRRLTPVKPDGSDDTSRKVMFIGETSIMSSRGPLPIHTPIEAENLEDAFNQFPEAVNAAVERMIEEAKEIQRQEASRIVVPGQGGPGGLGGLGGPGGPVGPGGKVTLR